MKLGKHMRIGEDLLLLPSPCPVMTMSAVKAHTKMPGEVVMVEEVWSSSTGV